MSEIVVGDVLTWEPDLHWSGEPSGLDRPLTWAVTIHASVPALPPLRGGELIVVPSRRLEELQKVGMIRWRDIAASLSGQAVAGLIVDQEFSGAAIGEAGLLTAPAGFMVDAEARLNRTITEHRAELYRLGSDLSRALSSASIGGADLNALLTVAAEIGKRDLLLFDASGEPLGRSRDAPRRLPPGSESGYSRAGSGWTVQQTTLRDGELVSLGAGPGTPGTPEAVRLLLSQTLTAVDAFLGPVGMRRSTEVPPSREAMLADLLLGRVPAAQIASRSQALAIEPDEPLSVALFLGEQPGFDGHIRTGLQRAIRERICMLSPLEMAILVPEFGWFDWWQELQTVARLEPGVVLVRSEQQHGVVRAGHATRQARMLARLRMSGVEAGSSVFDLLLPVWDPLAFEPRPDKLVAFAERLLGPLEDHDRDRNSDVVRTLEGYLAAGGSATGAAERLQVHRNTLGYRLRRISELSGADLDDEDVRLAFGLALRIRRLQSMLD